MGAVLIIAALLLLFFNMREDAQAGEQSEQVLSEIQSAVEKKKYETKEFDGTAPSASEPEATEETEPLDPEMPIVEINGYGYIGYVTIPDLQLELPVMSEWDYYRLEVAPCRHFGSSRTDDLVIAAHNYKSHFGSLSSLEEGAEILFTDMDGIENRYELKKMEVLSADSVDAVQNSGYDLVLYTCSPGGVTRVAAFCDRVTEEARGGI